MTTPTKMLREKIRSELANLAGTSRPSRNRLIASGASIFEWRRAQEIVSIWENIPVKMVTATIDDGFGHGIEVIELWARAFGVEVISLGLMRSVQEVIDGCDIHQPHLLGITVLQFDTEYDIRQIRNEIPAEIQIVAGGPLFQADSELAERAGINIVVKNAPAFAEFLLGFVPAPVAD